MNDWKPFYARAEIKPIAGRVYLGGELIANYDYEHPIYVTYRDEEDKGHEETLGEEWGVVVWIGEKFTIYVKMNSMETRPR